jgi:RES domain-containing protein
MYVFRITTEKWASTLTGSGYPARWNPQGIFMLYTASSRALACLENLVHRSGEGLNKQFRTVVIDVPEGLSQETVITESLHENWHTRKGHAICQSIGETWIRNANSCMLEVPSSIIAEEQNYLFNPKHPEFKKIKIAKIEDFLFDPRFRYT